MAQMRSTSRKINAILLTIKINWPKLVSINGYTLHGNIPSLSKNIAKSFFFGGATFLTHTVHNAKSAELVHHHKYNCK